MAHWITAAKPNPLTDRQRVQMIELTDQIGAVAEDIEANLPASRERALAITKLEEALMWANKAVVVTGLVDESTPYNPDAAVIEYADGREVEYDNDGIPVLREGGAL